MDDYYYLTDRLSVGFHLVMGADCRPAALWRRPVRFWPHRLSFAAVGKLEKPLASNPRV